MRVHLANATYGVLDYAAYPVGMLLVAPVVLRHLGVAEFGIWTVATAAVSTGGIVASGFGDANIQHVARLRGTGERNALSCTVRSMMGINLVLGTAFALIGWLLSPYAARHVASGLSQQQTCLLSLRMASVLMLVRAIESVSISTLRAYERYGAAVRISIGVRLLTLAAAAVLAYMGRGTASIMAATLILVVLGTAAQLLQLGQFLGSTSLWPAFDRDATRALFGFGIFSWLQADTRALSSARSIACCWECRSVPSLSLPMLSASSWRNRSSASPPSALHFLFPYLSGRVGILSAETSGAPC
jgi:O-antigen/teichoic acid export membrane protein